MIFNFTTQIFDMVEFNNFIHKYHFFYLIKW
jgi:hypothetical protein